MSREAAKQHFALTQSILHLKLHQKVANELKAHRAQRVVVLLVLLIFLGKAVGLYEIILSIDGQFRFQNDFLGPTSHDEHLSLPAIVRSWEFILLAVLGITMSVLLPALSPTLAATLFVAAALGVVSLSFASKGSPAAIPVEQSLVTILAIYMVNTVLSYLREARRRQRITEAFGHYVPPELVPVISQRAADSSLEGEAREMTVMFCDVHDFTAISAHLEPKQVAQLLNALFTPLTRIVHKHGGTIDKYMGDAIMAFWGAPLSDAEHAARGVMAALEIQETVDALGPSFQKHGWPTITMGIGINTGIMCVGNMGSQFRMAYTVVGNAVNLAARLQELTRPCRAPIIVGEATRRAFRGGLYRELGLVRIRGKDSPMRVFEPFRLKEEKGTMLAQDIEQNNQALRHYYRREWEQAAELFRFLRLRHPNDMLYTRYLTKIAEYKRHPPPANWSGIVCTSRV
jgi:adenylate cyclase